jgi:hypothetical protein
MINLIQPKSALVFRKILPKSTKSITSLRWIPLIRLIAAVNEVFVSEKIAWNAFVVHLTCTGISQQFSGA